jgi:hypothetical protein
MNKQTLSSYWSDNADGKVNKARAQLLFLACVELGLVFEYEGRTVSAAPQAVLNEHNEVESVQLRLPFLRQFDFTEQQGTVSVSVKRPPGRVELSVFVKAVS